VSIRRPAFFLFSLERKERINVGEIVEYAFFAKKRENDHRVEFFSHRNSLSSRSPSVLIMIFHYQSLSLCQREKQRRALISLRRLSSAEEKHGEFVLVAEK
jgi:hypothetical protein